MLLPLVFIQGLLLLAASTVLGSDDDTVVDTPLGKVRGRKQTSRSGKEYLAFTGLPYAKPPIGNLRFQPPSPVDPWTGVLNATVEPNSTCMQFAASYTTTIGKVIGQEDCLHLDVYTHNVSRKVPVLVKFHGGGFVVGKRSHSYPNIMDEEDIVLVMINYRLGILGFLSFENKEMPGNQGLKDQAMALRWVKQNIVSFGGDPNSVTITGCSAGGASVYHHIVSPLSRGLFHRAMSTSGSSYNTWALSPPGLARKNARILMASIDCPTDDFKAAIACAVQKYAKDVVENMRRFLVFQADPILTFSPVLENPGPEAFLESPVNDWNHNPIPLLVTLSSAEGLYRTTYLRGINEEFSKKFDEIAPTLLNYWASAENPDIVTKNIRDYYFQGKNIISLDDYYNLTYVVSDAFYNHGILEGANKHKGKVYFLYFDYVRHQLCQGKCIGADHCSTSHYLWKKPGRISPSQGNITSQKNELLLSQELIKLISNFMKTGIPKIPGSESEWKPWTKESNYYLHLNENGYTLKTALLQDRFNFWESINYKNKFEKYNSVKTTIA